MNDAIDVPETLFDGCCGNPKQGCFVVQRVGSQIMLTDPKKPEAGTAVMGEAEFRTLVRGMAEKYGMIPPAEGTLGFCAR